MSPAKSPHQTPSSTIPLAPGEDFTSILAPGEDRAGEGLAHIDCGVPSLLNEARGGVGFRETTRDCIAEEASDGTEDVAVGSKMTMIESSSSYILRGLPWSSNGVLRILRCCSEMDDGLWNRTSARQQGMAIR